MRTNLLLLLFSFTCIINGTTQSIYNDVKDSVVSLEHMFYLDAEDCENLSLIRELEQVADRKIINTKMAVQTGSGFIIDDRGYVLTNRHVVRFEDMYDVQNSVGKDIAESILEEHGSEFTESEQEMILSDFKTMFARGEYSFCGIVSEQEFELEVLEVSAEDEDDLALIRLNSEDVFTGINLADSEDINDSLIGKTVYSFGYPLGLTINEIFQDRIVSMNKGNISAFRDDELGIQHNAAISFGNSGGPLVNEDEEVVGINTALIESGNSLFYSIGIDRVSAFLNDRGYDDLLKWNHRAYDANGSIGNLVTNSLGEMESSSDLLILAEQGAKVFVDGVSVGRSPMYYTLRKDLSEIRIVGTSGEITAKVRRLTSLTGTTELIPKFVKKQSHLKVDDIDDNSVSVYADGRYIGTTPLETKLPKDTYKLKFRSENTIYPNLTLNLMETDYKEIEIQGETGYPVDVLNYQIGSDNEGSDSLDLILGKADSNQSGSFLFRSEDTELIIPFDSPISLTNGPWLLEVLGIPEWEGQQIEFEVEGETTLDLYESGGKGSLTIRNYHPGMEIFIDGYKVDSDSETIVNLPLGLHDVFIWKDGKRPQTMMTTIRNNENSIITFQPKMAHSTKAWIWGGGGLILAGTGLALGLMDTDPYAESKSDNYSEYMAVKDDIAKLSGGLLITGTLMLIPALVEWAAHRKDRRRYRYVADGYQL